MITDFMPSTGTRSIHLENPSEKYTNVAPIVYYKREENRLLCATLENIYY